MEREFPHLAPNSLTDLLQLTMLTYPRFCKDCLRLLIQYQDHLLISLLAEYEIAIISMQVHEFSPIFQKVTFP